MSCCCKKRSYDELVSVRFRDDTHKIISAVYVDEDEVLGHTIAQLKEAITNKIKRVAEESGISESRR